MKIDYSLYDQDENPGEHSRRRKRTRKWCRGKVGIEHAFREEVWLEWQGHGTYYVMKCTNCGRHGKLRWERWI